MENGRVRIDHVLLNVALGGIHISRLLTVNTTTSKDNVTTR